ncbi:MAG: hypothetical protein QY331_04175 [Melioribacteraceae bacterium]|nr:hypothetical protein [Melioribacteraceae bacterium]WKZ70450.1 MAG: hypothetical protein QY331_04175 [Melioribacteraceae bacterium]
MEFLAELHPQIIHFPIAILILYSVLEIVGILSKNIFLQKTSFLLLAIGVVSAVGAVLTGNQAAEFAKLNSDLPIATLINDHETYATITLWYYFVILILRTYLILKKKFEGILKFVFIPLVLIGSYLIYETGEHGGKLVYNYGIGTSINKDMNTFDNFENHD